MKTGVADTARMADNRQAGGQPQKEFTLTTDRSENNEVVTQSAVTQAAPSTIADLPEGVQSIVNVLDDRRAVDVVVLDLRGVSESLDCFIVATGESSLQLRALEESVHYQQKLEGRLPRGVEGPSDRWVLLDYGPVVVHLMSPEARDFYDLEGLWADAQRVEVTPI